MGVALEMSRWALRSEERGDGTDAIIANHIIELAQAGERDADRLAITPSPNSARPMAVQVNSSPPPRSVPLRSSSRVRRPGMKATRRCSNQGILTPDPASGSPRPCRTRAWPRPAQPEPQGAAPAGVRASRAPRPWPTPGTLPLRPVTRNWGLPALGIAPRFRPRGGPERPFMHGEQLFEARNTNQRTARDPP